MAMSDRRGKKKPNLEPGRQEAPPVTPWEALLGYMWQLSPFSRALLLALIGGGFIGLAVWSTLPEVDRHAILQRFVSHDSGQDQIGGSGQPVSSVQPRSPDGSDPTSASNGATVVTRVACEGAIPAGVYRERSEFARMTSAMGRSYTESFDGFLDHTAITTLFDGNVHLSPAFAFYGGWTLWGAAGVFKGGALSPKRPEEDLKRNDYDEHDSGARVVFNPVKTVDAIAADIYDDSPKHHPITLRVTSGQDEVWFVSTCEDHAGYVGFLGITLKGGIARAEFSVPHGTFALKNLTVVTSVF
jgi:hypothetical protein